MVLFLILCTCCNCSLSLEKRRERFRKAEKISKEFDQIQDANDKIDKIDKKRLTIKVGPAAVVHASRKNKTQWLMGVKSDKASHVVANGDFRVEFKDDAEAPAQVE